MMQSSAFRTYRLDRRGQWTCEYPGLRGTLEQGPLAYRRYSLERDGNWSVTYPSYTRNRRADLVPLVAMAAGAIAASVAIALRSSGL